jgi:hypothetical protein
MGLWTIDFFFLSKLLSCTFLGAPSLTRGRVCHVSVFVIEVYHSLVTIYNIFTFKFCASVIICCVCDIMSNWDCVGLRSIVKQEGGTGENRAGLGRTGQELSSQTLGTDISPNEHQEHRLPLESSCSVKFMEEHNYQDVDGWIILG